MNHTPSPADRAPDSTHGNPAGPSSDPSGPAPAPTAGRRRRGVRPGAFLDALASDARSRPWIDAVRRRFGEEGLAAAYQASLQGAVLSVSFEEGVAVVEASNERRRPFRVRVSLRPWTSGEESHAVDLLTNRAALVTELLSGGWSEEATQTLGAMGAPLGPLQHEEVSVDCDCPWAKPCLHEPVALVVLADLSRVRPGGFFALRGLPLETLLERVRRNRALRSQGMVAAHPEATTGVERNSPPLLEQEIDHFWSRAAAPGGEVDPSSPRPVSHALLRRMGPSPLKGKFPIVGLLASIYDEVSRRTREMTERLTAEDDPESSETPSADQ